MTTQRKILYTIQINGIFFSFFYLPEMQKKVAIFRVISVNLKSQTRISCFFFWCVFVFRIVKSFNKFVKKNLNELSSTKYQWY